MQRLTSTILAALIGLAGLALPSVASAADLVHGVYARDPGACGHPRVLSRISHRFSYQVRHVPHLPDVKITGFHRVGQTRYLPARDKWPVERRYCHASVALSDGKQRRVWYLLETPWGYAGVGTSVEFCVAGFDRWNVYNGNCRVLR